MVIAAILHDAIEDSTITLEHIREKFGEEVALYVYALTNDYFKGKFLEKNLSFFEEDPNILIIKLADRLHNLQTIDNMPLAIRQKKALGTLSV